MFYLQSAQQIWYKYFIYFTKHERYLWDSLSLVTLISYYRIEYKQLKFSDSLQCCKIVVLWTIYH